MNYEYNRVYMVVGVIAFFFILLSSVKYKWFDFLEDKNESIQQIPNSARMEIIWGGDKHIVYKDGKYVGEIKEGEWTSWRKDEVGYGNDSFSNDNK